MMNTIARELWYQAYLESALKYPAARGDRAGSERWAQSMALIADQFIPLPPEWEAAG